MIALWIPITIAAAFFQNARSAAQKRLSTRSGGAAATYARFVFAVPFTALFFAAAAGAEGAVAMPTWSSVLWASIGAMSQIFATSALVASFSMGPFTLGSAASKTEPVLAAVGGAVLLAEAPPLLAWLGIGLGVVGVVLSALGGRKTATGGDARGRRMAVLLGIVSAAFFALSAIGYRGASLSLENGAVALRAAQTLLFATCLQTVVMGVYMAIAAPEGLRSLFSAPRLGLLVGLTGATASLGWFTAMTLEPAAHVRALAQVELVFTVLASAFLFRERPTLAEVLGVAMVGGGAALLLVAVA